MPSLLEVDELSALAARSSDADAARRVEEFQAAFDVQPDCPAEELRRAARTSVALDAFAARHALDLLAYYYKGSGNAANEDTMSSIILGTSLLTARHIPVAGEYEVKNAHGDEDHGSAGRGRLIYRVLRDGFQRRPGADGTRRSWPHRDRRRQNQSAARSRSITAKWAAVCRLR